MPNYNFEVGVEYTKNEIYTICVVPQKKNKEGTGTRVQQNMVMTGLYLQILVSQPGQGMTTTTNLLGRTSTGMEGLNHE
jgi:hypothetical protein